MSESRQRFTGRVVTAVVGGAFLWLLFVTLPLFTSNLQVGTIDPRWLTPADLTWRRLVFNVLSKPGFRFLLVSFVGVLMMLLRSSTGKYKGNKSPRIGQWIRASSCSLEWVIDGRRNSSLAEYGSFVGVI